MASKTLTFTLIGKDGSASKAIQGVGRAAGGLGRVFAGMAATIAAAFSVAAIVNWGKTTTTALGRIEEVNAQTGAAIKSTGAAAWVTGEHIEALATKLENLTATEAESIQAGANMLLTFTNIQNRVGEGNDIFDQATTVLVDYARATKQDAATAAIMFGKALNDPLQGLTALSRAGVQFSASQRTAIESMVAAGDVMGAQKIILQELNTQFGGSGAAYAETYAGKVDLLKHAFGTFSETLLSGAMPALTELADQAGKSFNWLAEQDAVINFGESIAKAFGPDVQSAMETAVKLIDAIARSADAGNIDPLTALFTDLGKTSPGFRALNTILSTIGPLMPVIAEGLKEVGSALASEGVQDALIKLIEEALPPLVELLIAITPLIPPLASFLTTVLVPAVQVTADIVNGLTSSIKFLTGAMTASEFLTAIDNMSILGGAFSYLLDSALNNMRGIANVLNAFIGAVEGAVNGVRALAGLGAISLPRFSIVDTRANPTQVGYTPGSTGAGGQRAMAAGGIVRASFGGIPAVVGEGLYDEAVVPLSPRNLAAMSGGGGGIHVSVTVPGGFVGDERKLSQVVTAAIRNGIKRGDISSGWATA